VIGQRPQPGDFDRVVTSGDLWDGDRLVLRLVKRAVPAELQELALRCFGDLDEIERPSLTRRAAAGEPSLEEFRQVPRFRDAVALEQTGPTTCHVVFADGRRLRQPMCNPVRSYCAGYTHQRFTRRAEPARVTRAYPQRWADSLPFFAAVDAVLAGELPVVHAAHRARIAAHPFWAIPGTALSTVAINVNYESRYHLDTGDFVDGYSTLTVAAVGDYAGGLLVFPAHRVAVDVRPGDILLCQSHREVHGNTPIVPLSPGAKRVSFVTYLKHKLASAVNRLESP
jgi:hypothetical protein